MNSNLLEVSGLHVSAGEKEILHGVDLTVGKDETHVLMGPNGTGKSTLGYAITGNPEYTVTAGKIVFDGEDITELPVNERAKKGIFLSFQNPLEVPGVTLSAFIRSALKAQCPYSPGQPLPATQGNGIAGLRRWQNVLKVADLLPKCHISR